MKERRIAMVPAQPGWRAVYFYRGDSNSDPAFVFAPIVAWASWPPDPEDEAEFDAVVVDGECMGFAQNFSDNMDFLEYIPPEKYNKDWEDKNKERFAAEFENAKLDNKKKSS